MQALLITEPNIFEIIQQDIPQIQHDDDVCIRVKTVGICGSDVHIYHGTSPVASYPRIVGHEIAGEVTAIGKNVTNVQIGDHVVVEPIISCGTCYACRHKRYNACQSLKVRGCHVDGGMREYMVAPQQSIYKIDPAIAWEHACMVEPYTIAAQVTWRADIKKGDMVFIMGAGPIGLCILEMAKIRGGTCIISDYNEKRLTPAKDLGADYVLNPQQHDVLAEVRNITGGEGSHKTIDAVCTPQTFEQAIQITTSGGCVMCLGFTDQPSSIAQLGITLKELDVKGSRHQTFQFPVVVDLFNQQKLQPQKIISHIMPYQQFGEALDLIENHPADIGKIILTF